MKPDKSRLYRKKVEVNFLEKYLSSGYLGRIPSTASRNRTKTGKIGHEIGIVENGVYSETKN